MPPTSSSTSTRPWLPWNRRTHAHSHSRRAAGHSGAGRGEHLRHDGTSRHAPGHPSSARAALEPHAHEDHHGDADSAQAFEHPHPGGSGAAANGEPRLEEHGRRASGGLLHHLRRGARRALRRPYHHWGAGGAAGIRRSGLLAGTLRDHGVVEDPRALHAAHLLGRPSRHLLSLRRAQARAAREDVRRVPPRGGQAHLAFGARVRR